MGGFIVVTEFRGFVVGRKIFMVGCFWVGVKGRATSVVHY